ncbi:MAG: lytic transglycosylase domain-containing protein [Melioribacteraceae bacterium]|nr:lytic transglycosylase domain-containing protein [Melioribacteraceae bacterium]
MTKRYLLWSGVAILFCFLVATAAFLYLELERIKSSAPVIITEREKRISSPPIPEKLEFCGEAVPLNDFDIYERMDRELLVNTYWHSATLLYLKRANRWFPIIEPILEEYGIPDDFKYMAVAESGLSNAVSNVSAAGFWQFMDSAAKKYGLIIDDEIDERYNIEKATIAACKYLKESYAKYNNWTLAAASYNRGVNGIDRQLTSQSVKDYYRLFLNEETYRFVFRIIALKEIFRAPEQYGFYFTDDQLYQPFETIEVTVNYSIPNLTQFARKFGIDYKILKIFNPWIKGQSLNNKNKHKLVFKIPKPGTLNSIGDNQ